MPVSVEGGDGTDRALTNIQLQDVQYTQGSMMIGMNPSYAISSTSCGLSNIRTNLVEHLPNTRLAGYHYSLLPL